MEPSNTKLRRLPNVRMVQNFHLVWLDGSIDEESDDCRNSITTLQQIVNTVNTFTDVDECIDFVTDVSGQNTFIIVSQELAQNIISIVQDIFQVSYVFIVCRNKIQHKEWMQQGSKVKGVYADIASISGPLKQMVQNSDRNSVSISFVKTTDGTSAQSLDTLDQSFMYTQILKEILLTIDFEQSHINEFLMYCRVELAGNTSALKNIDKIATEYRHHEPIWWYTYDSLLYSMVNKALRLMEVDLIIKMGFFVRDVHQHIAKLHAEQFSKLNNSNSFTVYRGQGLSQTVLDQLKKTQGGLISFNNFLSTSRDRAISHMYAESNHYSCQQIGVLFEISIDLSTPSSPFASIRNLSHYEGEEEILFSMHSVFRIRQVKQIDRNMGIWQVNLTLTSDTDPQLHNLTTTIRAETFPTATGWYRLGILLVKLGQFDKAEQVFDIMLEQTLSQGEKEGIDGVLGLVKQYQGKYTEAVKYYEKSVEICEKTLPRNYSSLATSYNNIGGVYNNMGEYSKALPFYEKAFEILEKKLPTNHPLLATSCNNIGGVYYDMGEYSKALSFYEKSLEICEKNLPSNHPDLATSYNNIGGVYDNMGEYSKALKFYERALEICEKTLPTNHPSLGSSYNNIGGLYYTIGEYSKALSFYKKSLEILEKTLPANHPSLATSYNNIGLGYNNMGEYLKALKFYERSLEICEKTLPTNHPSLATSYSNIGLVYNNMREYSKALPFFEKDLGICEKTLPANHPLLATSYNNIGAVYDAMGEYSKALSFFEKSLKIYENSSFKSSFIGYFLQQHWWSV